MNNLQYNINALKKIVVSDLIKKMAVYFTFYFLLVIMIFYNVEYITMDYFEFLLSTSLLNIYGLLDVVWMLFQIILVVYSTIIFMCYEIQNSMEFIILRQSFNKLFYCKFLFWIVVIVLFRIFLFVLTYILFINYFSFKISIFLKNILIYVFISFMVAITCFAYLKNCKMWKLILTFYLILKFYVHFYSSFQIKKNLLQL